MGYHDEREIRAYWTWATQYVLQDHMFEPTSSWTLPSHLYLVSEWSAKCSTAGDPMSCQTDIELSDPAPQEGPDLAWTDLTWLLHKAGITWAYYVSEGDEPDCALGAMKLRAATAARGRTRPVEPAAVVRDRGTPTDSWATSRPSTGSSRPSMAVRCRRSAG